jgi:exonuclease SbcC
MRPLRLEIEGLASFRQRQEINFAGLSLFVITGPTGAGKTTILDAITLAAP